VFPGQRGHWKIGYVYMPQRPGVVISRPVSPPIPPHPPTVFKDEMPDERVAGQVEQKPH
jgi:hypothetical protein